MMKYHYLEYTTIVLNLFRIRDSTGFCFIRLWLFMTCVIIPLHNFAKHLVSNFTIQFTLHICIQFPNNSMASSSSFLALTSAKHAPSLL